MSTRAVDTTIPPTTVAAWQSLKSALGIGGVLLYESGWGAPKVSNFAQDSVAAGGAALAANLGIGYILDPDHLALPQLAAGGVTAMKVGVEMSMESLAAIGVDTSFGSSSAGTLCFDLEESDWTADEALCRELSAIFYEACQGIVTPAQYGNPNLLVGISSLPASQRCEVAWAASYTGTSTWPTSTASIPQLPNTLWNVPGQRGWQWHGGQVVQGYDLDFDLIDFPLFKAAPPPPPPPPAPPPPADVTLGSGTYKLPGGATLILP